MLKEIDGKLVKMTTEEVKKLNEELAKESPESLEDRLESLEASAADIMDALIEIAGLYGGEE